MRVLSPTHLHQSRGDPKAPEVAPPGGARRTRFSRLDDDQAEKWVSDEATTTATRRQFFLGLPPDVFQAARVDGANNWQIFWHIALPLTRPALVVTALFEFQAAWTDLMRPLIYLRDGSLFTLPRGLKVVLD